MVSTERHRTRQRLLVRADADAPPFTRISVSVPGRGGSPLPPRLDCGHSTEGLLPSPRWVSGEVGWRACPPPPQERPASAPPRHSRGVARGPAADAASLAPSVYTAETHAVAAGGRQPAARPAVCSHGPAGEATPPLPQTRRPAWPKRATAEGGGGEGGDQRCPRWPRRCCCGCRRTTLPSRRHQAERLPPRTSGPVWATRPSQPQRATVARPCGAVPVEGGRGGEGCAGPSRDCGIFFPSWSMAALSLADTAALPAGAVPLEGRRGCALGAPPFGSQFWSGRWGTLVGQGGGGGGGRR